MSKKRKNEQKPGTFRNNPFHPLKGISSRTLPGTAAPKKTTAGEATDDADLFARSIRGARPIVREEDEKGADLLPQEKAPPETREEADTGLFLRAMTTFGTARIRERTADDEGTDEDAPRRSQSGRMRQLKKGTIRIARELDLHGSVRDDAVRKLQQFVTGAYGRGDQAVLVITGKGINSPEGPVLPAAVRGWLAGPGKSMVAEFLPAPRDRGGSGAIVVFLRRRT